MGFNSGFKGLITYRIDITDMFRHAENMKFCNAPRNQSMSFRKKIL